MDKNAADQITEAVEKVLALPPGNRREQNLNGIIDLLDKELIRTNQAYVNSVRAHVLAIEENRELRAEVQRLQSAAAAGIPA
jgi:phage baseplate assembly protein W